MLRHLLNRLRGVVVVPVEFAPPAPTTIAPAYGVWPSKTARAQVILETTEEGSAAYYDALRWLSQVQKESDHAA
jgi:hypothetical protein